MITILTIIFLVLGFIIGSFLNVVVYRYNTQKTLGGRSACMSCMHQLSWYELIPLFSFLGLRGRCISCKAKISRQYPLVEFITGIIFAGLFLKFQDLFFSDAINFAFTFGYYASMFSLLLVIAVYDLKHKIIPDTLALIFGILAFVGLFFFSSFGLPAQAGLDIHFPSIWEFLSGVIISLPFALLWLVSRGAWMGLGDAKLAIGLGWMLGLSRILSGVLISFWSGAIVGVFLLIFSRLAPARLAKRYGMKSEIPFAPFLVFGATIAFLFELHLFGIGF